ncbi:MAG: DUF6178 family protein [Thermodesulfobacteriota bacterium]
MDPLGIVVLDDRNFLTTVIKEGVERGLFTRDRADEISRLSVAMANKYVMHKEVDFRSPEELEKVQQTILKLIGVGLEIRSERLVEAGVAILMGVSPVDLFRIAHTRIEKLRHRWTLLLQDHRVEILVSAREYECLSELTCQRLAEMSIFSETEIHTIRSLTLEDELFSNLTILEYYETELERYEFLLRLRKVLPLGLLNKSGSVKAENLSEVDSIREALVNTLIVSACVDGKDPVTVSSEEVRRFLGALHFEEGADLFPTIVEESVLDLIHELAEYGEPSDAALLTKEVVQIAEKFMETVAREWDTVNSDAEFTFFKRWTRMVILSDAPDILSKIIASQGPLDEYDFQQMIKELTNRPQDAANAVIARLPWHRLVPDQIIRVFHELHAHQEALAGYAKLDGFTAADLTDLLEELSPESLNALMPTLKTAVPAIPFSLEDIEVLAGLQSEHVPTLLRFAGPPADLDPRQLLAEFRDGSARTREILFVCTRGSDVFPMLFAEAWTTDEGFVKRQAMKVRPAAIGAFLLQAAGGVAPKVAKPRKGDPKLVFKIREVDDLFASLPKTKKQAAVRYFTK